MNTDGEVNTNNDSEEEETSPRGAKCPRSDETLVEAGPEDKKLKVSTGEVLKTVSSKTEKTAPVEQSVVKFKNRHCGRTNHGNYGNDRTSILCQQRKVVRGVQSGSENVVSYHECKKGDSS